MNTTQVTDNRTDPSAGEPDEPSGGSLNEPRQRAGRARVHEQHGEQHGAVDQGAHRIDRSTGIDVLDQTGRLRSGALRWFIDASAPALDEALARHGEPGCAGDDAIRILIVDDERMVSWHARLCGVATTTDVITIDLQRDASETAGRVARPMDVDLLLCLDEAERQAAARGHSVEHELLLYFVHGVLHCLGHDDRDEASFAAMHAMEDEILRAIGVGEIFGRAARGGEP